MHGDQSRRNVLLNHLKPREFVVFTNHFIIRILAFQLLDVLRRCSTDHMLQAFFAEDEHVLARSLVTPDQFHYRCEACAAALIAILSSVEMDRANRERVLRFFNAASQTVAVSR